MPLLLMLHGADANAQGALNILKRSQLTSDAIILAIDSRFRTWDIILPISRCS
ncbi:hypothetical protein [Gloeothece verrucosa]|uniref:hypothetical protein n=1 Tax=Gloeothece verrucosa TaxID=2546359 RepID=UPI000309F001|nr:hypothetical protein [Gloeothece verrucosa]